MLRSVQFAKINPRENIKLSIRKRGFQQNAKKNHENLEKKGLSDTYRVKLHLKHTFRSRLTYKKNIKTKKKLLLMGDSTMGGLLPHFFVFNFFHTSTYSLQKTYRKCYAFFFY